MPRPPRIHLVGGTYYVLQLSSRHQPLFTTDNDYEYLEQLLAKSLVQAQAHAHAYCWLPHALHLAIRTCQTPVSRIMQGLTGSYARHLNRLRRDAGHVFSSRFHSTLVDPTQWLPELVRYIHYAPVQAQLAENPNTYPQSSYPRFTRSRAAQWIDSDAVFSILEARGMGRAQACEFLAAPPPVRELQVFADAGRGHNRILGSTEFLESLPRSLRRGRPRLTLDTLTDLVARGQGTTKSDLHSHSRQRDLALCRSLVAWHAIERRVATLTEVARYFSRDASTLSKAIIRHRQMHPELFQLNAWRHLVPIA
ncbi:REP element-mobilizing transposase RayT [Povalibacter uvarum]|uniref:REP element-mobilizing transposase RayT n=1 Tax=Povalibacter uvarum TaxID=732238 RepID=A0A841HEP3_9GAMM|nr:transposase [Povalibacter uvarum]MBB6091226.1 REP element-mobilizing transposase RayT [Povalibacter uvarum]